MPSSTARALASAILITLGGCASGPACPTDRPLEDGDLTCECGGLEVDSLPCETMYCTEDGTVIGAGGCT